MFKTIFCSVLLFAIVLQFQAMENPIYKLFPYDITFHLSFDQGDCIADMANGKNEPTRLGSNAQKPALCDNGLIGKGLSNGEIYYDAVGNLDLTRPGTVIAWVSPTWDSHKPEAGIEPGFTLFQGNGTGKDYSYQFIIGKMSGQPWTHGHLNAYVQYIPATIKHVNTIVFNAATAEKWPRGEWRMLVCTWNSGQVAYSINGGKSTVSSLKNIMNGKTKNFSVTSHGPIIIDEVAILNKALTDEEIEKLYQTSKQLLNSQSAE